MLRVTRPKRSSLRRCTGPIRARRASKVGLAFLASLRAPWLGLRLPVPRSRRHRVVDDRSDLDRNPAVIPHEAGGNLDGLVEIARVNERVTAQLFASFGEGPVGQQPLALAHADRG